MSAGVFAADVDTGTLTIKGNIAESPCKFEAGGDSVSINMPTVPTTVFEGKAKYSTYDGAVGVNSSMLKISCPIEVAGVKLSLITNDKITGNDKAIASSNDTVGYYKFEAGGDSVSINMPTVPTTVFEGKAKYSTYDGAVGVNSSMLKISCPIEVAGVKLSLITNDKITGNDKAIASSNDTVGYYLYLGDNSDFLDVSATFNIESYKTAEGQYAIPLKSKYLKLTDNSVQSGDVLYYLVMRVAKDL